MSAIAKYPLTWPDGLPRTERHQKSQFKTGLSAALKNVQESLRLFGVDTDKPVTDIILSSNVGGLDFGQPDDPGVAAWFTWDGQQRCVAVDRYPKAEDNLQAIHHVLEARRTEMRHGGLHIVRQTFKGFTALPAPPRQEKLARGAAVRARRMPRRRLPRSTRSIARSRSSCTPTPTKATTTKWPSSTRLGQKQGGHWHEQQSDDRSFRPREMVRPGQGLRLPRLPRARRRRPGAQQRPARAWPSRRAGRHRARRRGLQERPRLSGREGYLDRPARSPAAAPEDGFHEIDQQPHGEAGEFEPVVVKWFDELKGYGFLIRGDDDVFVHAGHLRRAGLVPPADGEFLEARVAHGEKGLIAVEVRAAQEPQAIAA
jgi:cold shock CspA family protein